MKLIFKMTVLASAVALVACSALEGDKVDYRSTTKAPSLSIPPDLSQLPKDNRYTVIDGAISASGGKTATPQASPSTTAAKVLGDVRIERDGSQRWLVVKRPPAALWDTVKDFWRDNNFTLLSEQSTLGIMETDWAENRAKLPSSSALQNFLSKIFDSITSSGERDKYRTRLETNANGETEIYISHRGLKEVFLQDRGEQTVWQPRPADPELEAEFLRRLMLKLGSPPEQASAQVSNTAAPAAPTLQTININGQEVLQLEDDFNRAWRRVGLSLDRTGFTVEDRDRKKGLYYVRYQAPTSAKDSQEPGFFSRLLGASSPKPAQPSKFMVSVQSKGSKTTVSVLDAQGAPDTSETARNIVTLIAQDLR